MALSVAPLIVAISASTILAGAGLRPASTGQSPGEISTTSFIVGSKGLSVIGKLGAYPKNTSEVSEDFGSVLVFGYLSNLRKPPAVQSSVHCRTHCRWSDPG